MVKLAHNTYVNITMDPILSNQIQLLMYLRFPCAKLHEGSSLCVILRIVIFLFPTPAGFIIVHWLINFIHFYFSHHSVFILFLRIKSIHFFTESLSKMFIAFQIKHLIKKILECKQMFFSKSILLVITSTFEHFN